jgi:hypothetical protein
MRIGIDFGGVIVRPACGDTPMDFVGGSEIMMPKAFDVIAELVSLSDGNVWIVSKASSPTRSATRRWLDQTQFYQKTHFHPSNVLFCEKRAEKRQIAMELELTHFIDDNAEVIAHLQDVVDHVYLFGKGEAASWEQLLKLIRSES